MVRIAYGLLTRMITLLCRKSDADSLSWSTVTPVKNIVDTSGDGETTRRRPSAGRARSLNRISGVRCMVHLELYW
jgi:hypothetical protein